MSIAPPPSNSSASSTTDIAPTYTTSKVFEGHEPNIPGRVSDKYQEELEDSSKRAKENISAQEDLIKSLPRKDVSFGAEAALDRDRVPPVKRTEVHAVPAETSTDTLLKDKQISLSDVQITPTTSQSKPTTNEPQYHDMLSKLAPKPKSTSKNDQDSQLSKQDQQWSNSATREENMNTNDSAESKPDSSPSKPVESKPNASENLSTNETSTLHSKFTNQLSKEDKQLEESAKEHQQQLMEQKEDKEIIPLQKDGSFQGQTESTKESIKNQLEDTKEKIKDMVHETKEAMTSPSKQDSHSPQDMSIREQAQNMKENVSEQLNDAKDTMKSSLQSNQDSSNVSLQDKAENWKDNAKDKLMEAKDTAQTKLDETKASLQSKQGSLRNEAENLKDQAKDKLMEAKDSVQNKLHQSKDEAEHLKDKAKEKLREAKDTVENKLNKSTETSTAKQWEDKHLEPFDIPRTSAKQQETREQSEASSSESESVLPTDQYDLKQASNQSSEKLEEKPIEPKSHLISDTLAGLVHTVTQLPERAKHLFNQYEQSSSHSKEEPSSTKLLPTDLYDLEMDKQREAEHESTKPLDTTKSTEQVVNETEKVIEEKHTESADDQKSAEPKHHSFIQDKLTNLMHTVTELPSRAKELIGSKHEENKSQPPSPRETPTVQEREEKSQQSDSLVKTREFDPEEVSFF